jgi:hypothetical protein
MSSSLIEFPCWSGDMKQIEDRLDHHRAKIFGTITVLHFLLSVALFFLWGAVVSSRFDAGGPPDLTLILVNGAFKILSFPLLMGILLLKIPDTGIWGWLLFLGNSLLWGWAGWSAIRVWRSRRGDAQLSL